MELSGTASLVLLVVVILGLVVLSVFLLRNQARHVADAAALGTWATEHGYTYVERNDQAWTDQWRFPPFGIGNTQHADHVVSGSYGTLDFMAFDYRYDTQGATGTAAGSHQTWHFAMVVVTLPQPVPWFDARKRHAHLLPHHDANEFTVGDEAFDKHFIVHADNQSYAMSALTQPLRSMMSDHQFDGVRVSSGRLFAWRGEIYHTAATLPERLAAAVAAASGLPPAPVAS